MTAPSTHIPPGPGFVIGVAAATGVHHADDGRLAQLLITHPGPRRDSETIADIHAGMRSLATALHLGPGTEDPPMIGGRIMIRNGLAALDYGHDHYVMTIPYPSQDWVHLLTVGAPCRICLVLAPLPLSADRAETAEHIRKNLDRGTVLWGTTYARRRL